MNSQCRKPIEHFLKMLDEVTLKDIASFAEKLISSPLTMASWGDGMLPYFIDARAFIYLISVSLTWPSFV